MLELAKCTSLIVCAHLMLCTAGNVSSDAVDIFNVSSGIWSAAALSTARGYLAATSLPSYAVAIFAGGESTCCHVDFSYLCVWLAL